MVPFDVFTLKLTGGTSLLFVIFWQNDRIYDAGEKENILHRGCRYRKDKKDAIEMW